MRERKAHTLHTRDPQLLVQRTLRTAHPGQTQLYMGSCARCVRGDWEGAHGKSHENLSGRNHQSRLNPPQVQAQAQAQAQVQMQAQVQVQVQVQAPEQQQ
jgi:hypothetical protein